MQRLEIALHRTELDPAGLANHERTASLNGLAAGRGNSGSARFRHPLETACSDNTGYTYRIL